jgi:preprotein translocase subunit SecE
MAKTIAVEDQQATGMDKLKSRPRELMEFLKEVRAEMRKVITPTRAEVQSTTTIVVVTVFLFAGYFFLVDYVVGQGVTQLIHHLTQK